MLSENYWKKEKYQKPEFLFFIIFSLVGMMIMISARHFMLLYLAIELQALCLYVLTSYRVTVLRSCAAGVKYFILGALASCFLLYGFSFIYGSTGTLNYRSIESLLQFSSASQPLLFLFGFVFILVGLCFKLAAAPFHIWAPDVYEGAPTIVTAYISNAPKIAFVAVMMQLLVGPFKTLMIDWQQIMMIVSILSVSIGALSAIMQTNIKRMLAFSSIGHMGYILMGLVSANEKGFEGVLLYLFLYIIASLGIFSLIVTLRKKNQLIRCIDDLKGLAQTHPALAVCMTIFMLSLAGIPPLAGFFGKFYIFMAVLNQLYYIVAIIGVLASVVSAFYYLRIIKFMYFDQPVLTFDKVQSVSLSMIHLFLALIVVTFFLMPDLLLTIIQSMIRVIIL